MTQHEQEPAGRPADQRGISRRDVMRRGALVGGAMVWATPMVQTMARPAFAVEGTPVNMSWAAFTFLHDGRHYGFKIEVDTLGLEEPGDTPCCAEPEHWGGGSVANALHLDGVTLSVRQSNNCLIVGGFPDDVDTVHYAAMNAGGDTDSTYFEGDRQGCGNSGSDHTLCAKGERSPSGPDNEITICDDEDTG